jgi:outer membrane protein OmpA-like peptidoglycan-associated protein
MSDGYSIPEADTLGMLGDAHWTNFAENKEFFLNENNPTNFERTYGSAQFIYSRIRAIQGKVPFDQLVDFSLLQKLGKEPKYSTQKDEYKVVFAPTSAASIQAESPEILTKTVVIHFYPNSWDIKKMVTETVDGQQKQVLYDPNVDFVVEEVGKLAGQYGAARVVIEGHTDGSMRGEVDPSVVKELSLNRANSVREALLKKFPTLQPNQFAASGVGWDRPIDPANHAKNRRVEIKVYPAEVPQQ